MGEGLQFIDIILLAMLAGFIALRLKSVLGRRTGNERPPTPDTVPNGTAGDRREGATFEGTLARDAVPARSDTVVQLEADPRLREGFGQIQSADPQFDVDYFIDGARHAYELVLEAFWAGDRESLRPLLSDEVFEQFDAAIGAREDAGHVVDNRIVDLAEATIADARLNGTNAEIAVRFETDLITVTRDGSGKVVDGNLSDATRVTDVWTFTRDTRSGDPNWTLVATRAG